jgi:hypothetical protein
MSFGFKASVRTRPPMCRSAANTPVARPRKEAPRVGYDLTAISPNVIARPSTVDEARELIRTSGTVENVSELARRLGWTRSKLIRFLDHEEEQGRITRSMGSTGRALVAVSDPIRTPVRTPEQRPEPITPERGPDAAAGGGWWDAIGRRVIGLVLVAAGVTLAITSMQANAWFGYSLTTDAGAGAIFSRVSVTAEIIACALPSANWFYWQDGDWWTALKGVAVMCVALMVVFFAASGFVMTNLNDSTLARAERTTPTIEIAQRALDDARAARDRECVKVGPICRMREDAVTDRQRKLDEARAEVRDAADPQAEALHITPNTLQTAKAGVMVLICLAAGYIISFGWGLLFRTRSGPTTLPVSSPH